MWSDQAKREAALDSHYAVAKVRVIERKNDSSQNKNKHDKIQSVPKYFLHEPHKILQRRDLHLAQSALINRHG